jgi:hypothetical protein
MAGTVVAVFDDHGAAEHAATVLHDSGIPVNDISLVRKGAGGAAGDNYVDRNHPEDDHEEYISHAFREVATHDVEEPVDPAGEVVPRAVAGIVAGMSLGVLLVATSVVIPGMGAVIATGPLAAFLTGSAAGGVVGALVGALSAGGIPTASAQYYHERVAGGDTLVAVMAGGHNIERVERLVAEAGGHDIRYFRRLIDSMQSIES